MHASCHIIYAIKDMSGHTIFDFDDKKKRFVIVRVVPWSLNRDMRVLEGMVTR